MADYIPFHVQAEIIKRLPIISLLQFRSVSKAWKSLIDSSNFIAAHSVTQPQHLLFWYEYQVEIKEDPEDPEDPVEIRDEFVSFLDDDTFPKQRFVHTLPQSFKRLYHPSIVGSSFGLLCFCGHLTMGDVFGPKFEMIVLWNPSIRKSISVAVPNKINHDHNYGLGFGVCPVTRDPKIVRITQFNNSSYHCEAKVYTVSSGKWRSLSSNLPRKQLWIQSQSQAVDKFIYWCAFDLTTEENGLPNHNLIMSFDTTNENFGEIDLPDKLKHHLSTDLSISKIRVSLVMLEYNNIVIETWSIWIMENGVQKSFTKLYTVEAPYGLRTLTPLGFRNSGQPILEVEKDHEFMFAGDELVAYEPNTKRFDYLEIYGTNGTFVLNSYMETLLLLGRSDYNIVVDDDGQEHMITFGPDGSGMCFKLC